MAVHPESLRRDLLAADPSAPWVTWYAPDGARVELSAGTLDNWVAKAGSLLAEEYDIGPGSTVVLDLPLHWVVSVWAWAVWSQGAAVGLPGVSGDLAVVAPDRVAGRSEADVLACGMDAFAMPLGARTPTGAVDVMADLRGYPDRASFPLPSAELPTVATPEQTLNGVQAVEAARGLVPTGASRVLATADPTCVKSLLAATLAAPATGGSTVLAVGLDASRITAISAQERIDAVAH